MAEMAGDWRTKILRMFSNGTEEDLRRFEDESLRRERERRRLARLALARQKQIVAQEKRAQASYQNQSVVRKELLQEAEKEEHDAKRLRSGEIGLLEAMGIAIENSE